MSSYEIALQKVGQGKSANSGEASIKKLSALKFHVLLQIQKFVEIEQNHAKPCKRIFGSAL